MAALRAARVEWPIPNRQGHPSCPLCGLSVLHFAGIPEVQDTKLERHIASPHSHCKDCGRVMGAHRFVGHRRQHHRFPTIPIPGLEHVA